MGLTPFSSAIKRYIFQFSDTRVIKFYLSYNIIHKSTQTVDWEKQFPVQFDLIDQQVGFLVDTHLPEKITSDFDFRPFQDGEFFF